MLFGEIPPTAIDGTRPRKSGSHRTPRWSKPDSNRQSLLAGKENFIEMSHGRL
jgi:hypothetical protein